MKILFCKNNPTTVLYLIKLHKNILSDLKSHGYTGQKITGNKDGLQNLQMHDLPGFSGLASM